MGDQHGQTRRVRRVLPPSEPATQAQAEADKGQAGPGTHATPNRSVRTAPIQPAQDRRAAVPPPRNDLYQYLIGGLVSATVLVLLIVIWLVATGGNRVVNPALGSNTSLGSGDVPTIQLPLLIGTLVPGEVPTSNLVVPPAQPSRGP
jgi:hypothetical protein